MSCIVEAEGFVVVYKDNERSKPIVSSTQNGKMIGNFNLSAGVYKGKSPEGKSEYHNNYFEVVVFGELANAVKNLNDKDKVKIIGDFKCEEYEYQKDGRTVKGRRNKIIISKSNYNTHAIVNLSTSTNNQTKTPHYQDSEDMDDSVPF